MPFLVSAVINIPVTNYTKTAYARFVTMLYVTY